ncbi:unnamed protein product [Rotaria sp. Silwood2]|nr:unnamed protein product [Rotaria sp. Silwood2]
MLNILGDTGHCWVSPKCSIPELFHSQVILPLLNNTRIFYNTVIKHITKDSSGRHIIQIDAIQRSVRQTSSERCRFLSEELPDWYSQEDSLWFTKTELSFRNISFVIEGSSWGEVLVLSNASYIQGLMEQFDGDTSGIGNSTCGQSFTFDFLEPLSKTFLDEPSDLFLDATAMKITIINGHAPNLHGYIFDDRLCIGAYNVDIHSMIQCTYLSYIRESYPILPYYILLCAMTNRDIDHLIVIGKTMA